MASVDSSVWTSSLDQPGKHSLLKRWFELVRASKKLSAPQSSSSWLFGFPCFFSLQGTPCFSERFPFFPRNFRGLAGAQILAFFGVFPCFLTKNKEKKIWALTGVKIPKLGKRWFRSQQTPYSEHWKGVVLISSCFQNFHLVVFVVPRNTGIYSVCIYKYAKKKRLFSNSHLVGPWFPGFESEKRTAPFLNNPLPALWPIQGTIGKMGALDSQQPFSGAA